MLANLLDRYERKARLAPAMLVALPAALVLAAIGWTLDQALLGTVAAVLVAFGVPIAMANYTRMAGKHIEAGLWTSWGGSPTSQLLRHTSTANPHRRSAVHARLAALVPELPLPTPADEQTDPHDSDQRWEAVTEIVRSRLRDRTSSRLLFEENCTYGFHRNMLGLRTTGLRVAATAAAATIGAIALTTNHPARTLLAFTGAAAWLATWLWHRLGPSHAHRAAISYAEAFLGAVLATPESISGGGPSSPTWSGPTGAR